VLTLLGVVILDFTLGFTGALTLGFGAALIFVVLVFAVLAVLVALGLLLEVLVLLLLEEMEGLAAKVTFESLFVAVLLEDRVLMVVGGLSGNEDGNGVLEVMALGGLPPRTLKASNRRGSGTCNGAGSARLLESKVPSRSSICPGTLCARLFQLAPMMVSVITEISTRQNFCLVILEHLLWAFKPHAMRSSNKKSCWQRISSPSSVLRD
jgi:hypothetical protein